MFFNEIFFFTCSEKLKSDDFNFIKRSFFEVVIIEQLQKK